MRLIDADELILAAQQDGAYGYVSDKEIADAPTVEAVPVIRCVDCVHIGCDEGATWCTHPRWVQLDGYCANGERREDETD